MTTYNKNSQQEFSFEVVEVGHFRNFVQSVKSIQPALRIQVAIATYQLRWTHVAQTEVFKLSTSFFYLSLRLLRQPKNIATLCQCA